MSYNIPENLVGLSNDELDQSRNKYGYNQPGDLKKSTWYKILLDIFKEPMLLLLLAVSIIYVILNN